jgi:hypothetical protein
VLGLNRILMVSLVTAISLLSFIEPAAIAAPGMCLGPSSGPSPLRREESRIQAWDVQVVAQTDCQRGVLVELSAKRELPGERPPGSSSQHPLGPSGILTVPIFCRRDDYMLLPPNAQAGLPCVSIPSQEAFDPRPLALRMEAELPPPDLRIGMNPAKGMVAVPTWFWVEGYDGGTLSQSETVLESHEKCHFVVERDADHQPILDEDGRPVTRRECSVESTTFVVDVRLWPNRFVWDFGDKHDRDIACRGQADCGDALGLPYVDSAHPSPIRHPYRWSSLGVNGTRDAYTISLGITFAADYRVSVGGSQGGWQSLPERVLTWKASHQVQEAQAVLTRP